MPSTPVRDSGRMEQAAFLPGTYVGVTLRVGSRQGDMQENVTDAFVAKVDAFAATLDPEEQAMLIELLGSDDEVSGFGAGWPGLLSLGVWKAPAGTEATNRVVMSGGSTMVVFEPNDEPFDATDTANG